MDLHTWAGNYHSSLILLANSLFSVMLPESNVTCMPLECENKLEHVRWTWADHEKQHSKRTSVWTSPDLYIPQNHDLSILGGFFSHHDWPSDALGIQRVKRFLRQSNILCSAESAQSVATLEMTHVSCAIWFYESSSRRWYSSAIMVLSMWKLRWHLASVNVSLSNF